MKYSVTVSKSKSKFPPIIFQGNLEKNLILIKKLGFSGVEFNEINPEKINISELANLLEKTGLVVSAFGSARLFIENKLSFTNPDKFIRKITVNKIREISRIAKIFNSPVIIGLVRGNKLKDDIRLSERIICECLEECMHYDGKDSTSFLLEPINKNEIEIFNKLEDTALFLNEYKNRLDPQRIGIFADVFHMNIEEAEISETIKKYHALIKYIHFADSNRLAPGDGNIDFSKIMDVLKMIDYNSFISFEFLSSSNSNIEASKAIKFITSL